MNLNSPQNTFPIPFFGLIHLNSIPIPIIHFINQKCGNFIEIGNVANFGNIHSAGNKLIIWNFNEMGKWFFAPKIHKIIIFFSYQ